MITESSTLLELSDWMTENHQELQLRCNQNGRWAQLRDKRSGVVCETHGKTLSEAVVGVVLLYLRER